MPSEGHTMPPLFGPFYGQNGTKAPIRKTKFKVFGSRG